MQKFKALIEIIGINPYVLLPGKVLAAIFKEAQKDKGPISVKGTIDGHNYIQTLVKYSGEWRLYVNTPMMKASGKGPGNKAVFTIEFDPEERVVLMHPKLKVALQKNKAAMSVFEKLPPSRQKEVKRYIANLKTEESVERNVQKAIQFLVGKQRFIGRDTP